MINLDSNDPDQVVSKSELQIDLGPNEQMYVQSGIALPEWVLTDDDHQYDQDVYVNLRKAVKDVEQSTFAVGLASIENSGSSYLFAADTAELQQDDVTQELILHVHCVARGDVNKFHRFSYQVAVKVTTQTTGIAGKIFWPTSLFDARDFSDVAAAQSFIITANVITHGPAPTGGFGSTTTTVMATGTTGHVSITPENVEVPYEIVGAPYGTPLTVLVDVTESFPPNAASPFSIIARQADGPNPVVITPAVPGVAPVDFAVSQVIRPK